MQLARPKNNKFSRFSLGTGPLLFPFFCFFFWFCDRQMLCSVWTVVTLLVSAFSFGVYTASDLRSVSTCIYIVYFVLYSVLLCVCEYGTEYG
jgi:hypothetical protein